MSIPCDNKNCFCGVLNDITLCDDGTMDTVVNVDGEEYRYDGEMASEYRDESGALDFEKFVREVVLEDCDIEWENCERCDGDGELDPSDIDVSFEFEDCEVIEDIDSNKTWLCRRQVETHKTKKRWTWLVVRLEYTRYWSEEWADSAGEFNLELLAVNPGILSKSTKQSLLDSFGMNDEDWEKTNDEAKVCMCINHGTKVVLWQAAGNKPDEMAKKAAKELLLCHMLLGFKLDQSYNGLGSTGWDLLRGDLTAGAKRNRR